MSITAARSRCLCAFSIMTPAGKSRSGSDSPGVSNAWTMPIKARVDMLSTGIRTPIGIKMFGADLEGVERLAREIEAVVRTVPGTTSAFAERVMGGYYLEIEPDRSALARYGLKIGDVQEVIRTGLGAEAVTTTVEGRERYTVKTSAIRAPSAPVRRRPPPTRWLRLPTAEQFLSVRSPRSPWPKGRPASAPRTPSSSSTSSSISATGISAATSRMRRRRWPSRCASRKATTRRGAASSNTCSERKRG